LHGIRWPKAGQPFFLETPIGDFNWLIHSNYSFLSLAQPSNAAKANSGLLIHQYYRNVKLFNDRKQVKSKQNKEQTIYTRVIINGNKKDPGTAFIY
jgi:hypothetical protein